MLSCPCWALAGPLIALVPDPERGRGGSRLGGETSIGWAQPLLC